MKKILAFLKQNYRKIAFGLVVGLFGFSPWAALYAGIVAGCCMELKTGSGSWPGFLSVAGGGLVAALFWLIL